MSVDFNSDLLHQVRSECLLSQRSFILQLQGKLALDSASFLQWLSGISLFPIKSMQELHASTPDFTALNFTDCLHNDSVVVREKGQKLQVVIADPFNSQLLDRLLNQISEPFDFQIAHQSDIQAYLSKQEGSQRAMQSWSEDEAAQVNYGDKVEVISLQ